MNLLIRATLFLLFNEYFLLNANTLDNSSMYVREGIEHNLIQDYLTANDLKICVVLYCNRSEEYLRLFNQFYGNVWYSFVNVLDNPIEYETLLMRFSHNVGVVIDLECANIFQVLREISKRMLFHHERYWLMFSPNSIQAFTVLETQNINVDAEITIAVPVVKGDEKTYQLLDVYNPSSTRDGKLNITQVGTWKLGEGYKYMQNQTKLERRRDFQGITFTGVVVIPEIPENETFIEHLESVQFHHLNSMSRHMYRLFAIMQQTYNFKMFMRRARIWGTVESNGRWNGAIGMLNRHEVDACVSGLRWEDEHYGIYEATTNAYASRAKFIFRHPKSVDGYNIFTSPFDKLVWFCIFILCIACAYALRHIFAIENHRKVQQTMDHQPVNEDSWSNSLLLVFGILFQQGYSSDPVLISSRILTLTVLVFSLFIFQFYSSFIVGTLLTETPKTITTMKKLLDSHLEFGVDDVPYILDSFERTTEESTVKLYNRIMNSKEQNVMALDKGMNLIKRGGFAFNTVKLCKRIRKVQKLHRIIFCVVRVCGVCTNIGFYRYGYRLSLSNCRKDGSNSYLILKQILTDDEICDLQDVTYTRESPIGPAVPNKSPLTELIKISIRRMTEVGILAYHSKTWLGSKPDWEKTLIEVVPVDLIQFSLALYFIAGGVPLSTMILFAEIMIHRFHAHKQKKDVKVFVKKLLDFGKLQE